MDRFRQRSFGQPSGDEPEGMPAPAVAGGEARRRTSLAERVSDGVTEAVLYVMVVFTPWAFGTTQEWAIWVMNVCGYLLGLLLVAKWVIRRVQGQGPMRWGGAVTAGPFKVEGAGANWERWLARWLAVATALFLGYCLTAAVNARATYYHDEVLFKYHDFISWLPHSYDSSSSWFSFWMYLGLACTFWAARDWLLGLSRRERRRAIEEGVSQLDRGLPDRMRRLLWVLCINGSVLALQGILQRLDGTNKLLWLVEPRINKAASAQFGPYAYRANAAQLFNLIWPICLGFWLTLRRARLHAPRIRGRLAEGSEIVLLPGAVLMAACPVISTSRGGAFVSLGLMLLAMGVVLIGGKKEFGRARAGVLLLFLIILLFGGYLGWKDLSMRIEDMFIDQMSRRTEIYENARPIADDFPVFGTGPGTFSAIYRLYRDPTQSWAAYLHDDWLEARITLGWAGLGILMAALGAVLVRWFGKGGIPADWRFVSFLWISLGGCLLHAKFDFPFQIYSVVFLVVLACVFLFVTGRGERSG